MAKRTNYTALDDIGFIGVDREAPPRQRNRQAKQTAAFIRKYQAGKAHNDSPRMPVRGVPRKRTTAAKSPFVTRRRTPAKVAKAVK
jgi:hypothetical protein